MFNKNNFFSLLLSHVISFSDLDIKLCYNTLMDANILKEFLKLYNQLPCGIMIFKNDDLYFINNHLREILTLQNLDVENSLDVIASLLHLPPSSEELLAFFSNKSFFSYKEKYIQISHKKYEEYEILVFVKLDTSVLEDIFINFKEASKITMKEIEDSISELNEENQDSKILEYFDKKRNVKVIGIVLYKGVPLISENIVLRTYRNLLVVKIEDKQIISSTIGTTWIIKTKDGVVFQAAIKKVNNDKKLIFLSNPKIIKDGYHKRQRIRYELNHEQTIEIYLHKIKTTLDIVDISENSLKVLIDNASVLKDLIEKKDTIEATMKIKDKTINLTCTFLKEGKIYDQKVEIIFLFTLNDSSKVVLNKWLNEQQIKVINKIRMFKNNSTLSN
ncbi:hypothetical protein M947_05600 [Sulfurimonas hongkongensis]|uniref:PilZ domain-containing protein n=1 Tax=Sulfurimonas hongkongensis TaxID=1172190 RepID=T0L122_9BACT|nr:hypothetical protein [Sulfurimonas hongkongensis]EQB39468.1 hypothetical protein M947_05600 [Sulfurimonas hongkongensis]